MLPAKFYKDVTSAYVCAIVVCSFYGLVKILSGMHGISPKKV